MSLAARRVGKRLIVAIPAAATALLSPSLAAACTVCFGGEESDWTTAFTFGTILIMALPPAIVVSGVFAIYRASKRRQVYLDAQEAEGGARPHRAPNPQATR